MVAWCICMCAHFPKSAVILSFGKILLTDRPRLGIAGLLLFFPSYYISFNQFCCAMPGTRCTVAVCNNSYDKTKKAGMNIIYHKFPNNEPYRSIWIEACRRAGKWNPVSCHICSIHFTKNDYKEAPHIVHNVCSTKKRLKPTAVPSLFLTVPPPIELETIGTRKKMKKSVDEDQVIMQATETNLNTQQSVEDIMTMFEVYPVEDSKDLGSYREPEEVNEGLESFEEYNEKKNDEGIEDRFSSLIDSNFITIKDCSTQTDTDYFLQNYQILVDKTEILEKELANLNNRYKKLMIKVKYLEAEVQCLTMT